MSMLDKLEQQFAEDNRETFEPPKMEEKPPKQDDMIDHGLGAFQHVLGERPYDELLDPNIKQDIRGALDVLEKFYENKIAPNSATYLDAFDYIPLFCISGALIATKMDIPYDDYLRLVDIMMVVLDIVREEV